MKLLSIGLLGIVFALGGCNAAKRPPLELIILPDISASIDPESQRQMFAAITDVAQHLHRGDTLTIIPITGDAEAELSGRTLRYEVPSAENRQAYDADLRKLSATVSGDLKRLAADAKAHPGKHTDILGSIRVAMKEFSALRTDKRLVVLSDFIQDDQQLDFRTDTRLVSVDTATQLAHSISVDLTLSPSVHIFLGRLKSNEFSQIPYKRRRAIDVFWTVSLAAHGIYPDGPAEFAQSSTVKSEATLSRAPLRQ